MTKRRKAFNAEEATRHAQHHATSAQKAIATTIQRHGTIGRPNSEKAPTPVYNFVGYWTPSELETLCAALHANVEIEDIEITFSRTTRDKQPKVIYKVKRK